MSGTDLHAGGPSQNAEFVYGRYRRSQLTAELDRLRDLGEGRDDDASQFIGGECRVAGLATARAYEAILSNDAIGSILYLRLIAETAIRVTWLADDDTGGADSEGRPTVDASRLRTRIRQLTRRDLEHLRASFVAIHDPGDEDPDGLSDLLQGLIDAIEEPSAPGNAKALATSRAGRDAYAGYRLCSAMVHPGAALKRGSLIERDTAHSMTEQAAYLCCAWSDAALGALA